MAHPRLAAFFTGVFDGLLAAYKRSEEAASSCKGSLREIAIREALEHLLPAGVRLYDGEIIDSFDRQSGQLDGILVHSTGTALAATQREPRIVLAEGVLGVLESKSNLASQWGEVVRTWEKLRPLRRFDFETHKEGYFLGPPIREWEAAIPFVVVAYKGYAKKETLIDKARELFETFNGNYPPNVVIVQLDPPGLAYAGWESAESKTPAFEGYLAGQEGTPPKWRVFAAVWVLATSAAHRLLLLPPNWIAYLNEPPKTT
jgi:hypothetical protein